MHRSLKTLASSLLISAACASLAPSAQAAPRGPTRGDYDHSPNGVTVTCSARGAGPIDISTGIQPWRVAFAPANSGFSPGPSVVVNPVHPLWSANLPPAKWVSVVSTSGTQSIAAGHYIYQVRIDVAKCDPALNVRLEGQVAADDAGVAVLDGPGGGITQTLGATTPGGWGFTQPKVFGIGASLGAGSYFLRMNTENQPRANGPSPAGLLVHASLTAF